MSKNNATLNRWLIMVICCLLLKSLAAYSQEPPSFGGRTDYTVGSWPTQACSADFNGDSWPDLAVCNYSSSTISILANNGDGTFQLSATYNVGGGPNGISTADLDGDGDYDLVFGNAETNNVSVMLNTGAGSFAPPATYPVCSWPHLPYIADLDGDNDIDIAVPSYDAGRVYILLNNGNGTFSAGGDYATGSASNSVYAGDFDGDSDNDLAVTNAFSNTVSILLNNGNGTYQPAVDYATGNEPHLVYGADFDGDAHIDLAVANRGSSTVSIFRNSGNAVFSLLANYAVGSLPRDVASADFDGDQDYDLAVSAYGESNVTILINDGTGTFQSGGVYALGSSGSSPRGICIADLDKDGDKDLVFGYTSGDFITVLYNTTPQPCMFGNALLFDGLDDYVYIAHNPSQNPASLTIEAYIKMDSIPTSVQSSAQAIVSKWRGSSSAMGSYMLGVASMADSGKVILNVEPSLALFSRQRLNPHQWYHVAATWDGSTAKIYIDSVLDTAASMAGEFHSTREITIGRNSHSLWDGGVAPVSFDGVIDEVRISSIARTPSEFCLTGECTNDANTVALWHFNETQGDTAFDSSDGNHGELRNGTQHFICCPDQDNDGICDSVDNCRFTYNPDQLNSDTDTLGDSCDNCDFVANNDQGDGNGNGVGDACDNLIWFDSTSIAQGYIQLMLRNGVDVSALTVPLKHNSTHLVDHVSKVGCRTSDWESFYGTKFSDTTLLIGGIADAGGGTPCLTPGEGPIARIYFTPSCTDTLTVCFDTTYINEPGRLVVTDCSVPPISITPEFVAGCTQYESSLPEPIANAGTDVELHVCGTTQLCIPAGCSDPNGDLTSCELVEGTGTFNGNQICLLPSYGIHALVLKAIDACGSVDYDTSVVTVKNCGDVNSDCARNITDVVYLIGYIFSGGPAPIPEPCVADVNGDGLVNITDAVYYINWVFVFDAPAPLCGCDVKGVLRKISTSAATAKVSYSLAEYRGISMLTLTASCSKQAAGAQLEFTTSGNIEIVEVTNNVAGMQEFHGTVDGKFKVGLLDLRGEATIPAGTNDVVTIKYKGAGEIKLVNAIMVGTDAAEMNVTLSSDKSGPSLPTVFSLAQNSPNPFNPTTEIAFAVPHSCPVRLEILNVLGQSVRTLVDEFKAAGNYQVTWDSRDNNSESVSSGVYFYRLSAGDFADTKKMVLMK